MTDHQSEARARVWVKIAQLTVLGTAAFLAFSLILNYLLLFGEGLTPFGRSVVSAAILPIAIGAPLFLFLGVKLQELKRLRRELTRSATYDQVTEFYNGRVFSSVVDRRVSARSSGMPRRGAFLVVDTENIRSINVRYGFGWGEEALRVVASTIRAWVRRDDIVGRLGASEFGIFLQGSTEENAREVGERIKRGVASTYFAPVRFTPDGGKDLLRVRVGGVIFEHEFGFDAMFRAAEQELTKAVNSDEIEISRLSNPLPEANHYPAH